MDAKISTCLRKPYFSGYYTVEKKAAIIIPFYKDELVHNESVALQQCFKILGNHNIIAIKPEKLVLPVAVTKYPFYKTTAFSDDFFTDVQGYNRLMLSAEFYNAFIDYEFILIYQLDAFVFKDELLYWCSLGFDYIGAPWIEPYIFPNVFEIVRAKIQAYYFARFNIQVNGLPSHKQLKYKVGNGGFSLRRTKKFYELCIKMRDKIEEYNKQESHLFNEDVFWSLEVNRRHKVLKKPGYKKALQFSFELHPKEALYINNNLLPFGCHAWNMKKDFWRSILKEAGYDV